MADPNRCALQAISTLLFPLVASRRVVVLTVSSSSSYYFLFSNQIVIFVIGNLLCTSITKQLLRQLYFFVSSQLSVCDYTTLSTAKVSEEVTVQLLTTYTGPERHSVHRHRQTDRRQYRANS